MKKCFLTFILAALTITLNAQQIQKMQLVPAYKPAADSELVFGYCGELESCVGYGAASTTRAAMEITPAVAAKYQGAQISKVRIGIGNNAGKDGKVLILGSLEGNDVLYLQEATFTKNSWNEITLDTPYTIGDKGFYVGYEVTTTVSSVYPIGVDNEQACNEGDWCALYDEASDTWAWEHIGQYGFGNVCVQAVLTGDNLPQYDVALQEAVIKEYVSTGKEFSITGTVMNMGVCEVTSFDVSCQIGDADPVVTTCTANIASNSTAEFQIEGLTIAEEGEYNVTLTITSINGNADEDTSNNSYSKVVKSLANLATRKVLVEEFSTTSCGNCPRAHKTMKEITEGRDDIALVVHHAGFGTDNFTIAASRSYTAFYDGSTYAPAMMIDRRNLADQGALGYSGAATGPACGITSKEDVMKLINYCFDQPAFISVNIEDVYNEETRELAVRVYGETSIDLTKTPFLNIFITESGMVSYQSGGGNDYVHNHAIRANLTSTWGDELTIENGKYDVTYTYTLDKKWDPVNMSVIAFVADYNAKDINDCVVYNTNWKEFEYGAGVNDIATDHLNVWAANGNIYVSGDYKTAEVYATDGRLVKRANGAQAIDIDAAGIYIVRIDGTTHKVIVK